MCLIQGCLGMAYQQFVKLLMQHSWHWNWLLLPMGVGSVALPVAHCPEKYLFIYLFTVVFGEWA